MENLNDELPTDAVAWQQFFYERFGDRDWDCYNVHQEHLLKRMIGFAMFGSPTELGDDTNEIGYGPKSNEQIQNIYNLIWKNHYTIDSSEILIRIIFISCEMQDKKKPLVCRPVFVVKKCTPVMTEDNDTLILYDSCNIFIDESARVYQSWTQFLNKNKLPKCKMYCPSNGQYKGEIVGEVSDDMEDGELKVMLEEHYSPACSMVTKFLKGSDRARTALSIGSTATFVAAAIPGVFVAPPIIAAAAVGGLAVGAYTVGRSVANLRDRKKHDQTIGFSNPDARSSWIDAGVGVLGASSSVTGIIMNAATQGANISQVAAQAAYNALNVASMVGTTTSFIFSGYNIYEKLRNNETPSSLDIFQFASSVLFFHKSVVGFKTARVIISETKSSTLKEYGDTLRKNRHKKLFKKAHLEALSTDLTQSAYQEIISGIQDMDDPNNFFYGLAKINKDLKSSGERYYITSDDLVKINKAYIIDSSDLLTTIGKFTNTGAIIPNSKSDNHLIALNNDKETKIKKSCTFYDDISVFTEESKVIPSKDMDKTSLSPKSELEELESRKNENEIYPGLKFEFTFDPNKNNEISPASEVIVPSDSKYETNISIGQENHTLDQSDILFDTRNETKFLTGSESKVMDQSGIVFETNSPISDTIFATKYTFMIRSVQYLLENFTEQMTDDTVKEAFRNLKDLETLTLLLKSQTDDIVKKILEILLRFMIILPSNVFDSFSKIYPFVSLLVGALQFLLRNFEIGALKFNAQGDNRILSVELCKKFTEWVDDVLDERTRYRMNPNFVRRSKLRKICTDCQGFYFVFED